MRSKKNTLRNIVAFMFMLFIGLGGMTSYAATTYNKGDVVITESGDYIIQNGVTSVRVSGNIDVNIRLENVNINKWGKHGDYKTACAFVVERGVHANIILVGNNTLISGLTGKKVTIDDKTEAGYAGLQVNRGASVEISGNGSLTAGYVGDKTAIKGGAGIGGGYDNSITLTENQKLGFTPGAIIINGGNIKAQGQRLAAGIGGGWNGAATESEIIINGGKITAQGGVYASGIGEGDSCNGTSNIGTLYKEVYEITINGGEIDATGGCAATGIGMTDQSVLSGIRLNLMGGVINVKGGGDKDGNVSVSGGSGIGAGSESSMYPNSITVGPDAVIYGLGYQNYAIHHDYLNTGEAPIINLSNGVKSLLVRFTSNSKNNRTLTVRRPDGSILQTFDVPANYKSIFVTIGQEAGSYTIDFDKKTYEVEIEDSDSIVSGQLVSKDSEFVPDNISAVLTDAKILDSSNKISTEYKFLSTMTGYLVYVKDGIDSLDMEFMWENGENTKLDQTQIVIECDEMKNKVTVDYTNDTDEASFYKIPIDIKNKEKTIVKLTKTDRFKLNPNDKNWTVSKSKVYTFTFIPQDVYELNLKALDKVYDSERVKAGLENVNYSEIPFGDIPDVVYKYYKSSDEELSEAPKDAGKYIVKAVLDKEKYIAKAERAFEISKRPISIESVQFNYKEFDGNNRLTDEQRDLGRTKWNNLIKGEEVEYTFDFDNSYYDSKDIGVEYITIAGVKLVEDEISKNYDASEKNRVYGEIYSLRRLLFTSNTEDRGEAEKGSWTKWKRADNTVPVYGSNEHSFNILGRTVNNGEEQSVYCIDIEFGDMGFVYGEGSWNPSKHAYSDGGGWRGNTAGSALVRITNRSNRPIMLKTGTELEFMYQYSALKIDTDLDSELELIECKHVGAEETAKNVKEFHVVMDGEPTGFNLKDWSKIGKLKIEFIETEEASGK